MDSCAHMCKCFLIVFNSLFAVSIHIISLANSFSLPSSYGLDTFVSVASLDDDDGGGGGVSQVLGLGLLSLSLWLRFGAETKGIFDIDLNTTQFTIGIIVLFVTGFWMLLVAVVGHYGACANSKTALGVFMCLVSLLVIVEIAAGVMAFIWSGRVSEELANFYISVYTQYVNSRSEGQAITLRFFHNAFDCCGIGGAIELFVRDTCPDGNILKQITFSSCPSVIKGVFQSKAPLVLGGFLGTAGILLVMLVCSTIIRRRNLPLRASPPAYVLLASPDPVLCVSPAVYQDF